MNKTVYGLLGLDDGGGLEGWGAGGSGTYEQLVPALRPVKNEEITALNNNIKEVGTPPVTIDDFRK